jgi:RimJ/RimL family protein N-acetyltransferase
MTMSTTTDPLPKAAMPSLTLRLVRDSDALAIYRWQRDPETRRYFHKKQPPTWEEHLDWFVERYARERTRWYIVEFEGTPVGSVWVQPGADGQLVLSIVIAPEVRGKGIGREFLRLASLTLFRNIPGLPMLFADVHEENVASAAIFARAGYKRDSREGSWTKLYVTAELLARAGGPRPTGGPMKPPVV